MADTQEQLKTWQNLKQQGIDGEFRLDKDIGHAIITHCETFLLSLDEMLQTAQNLEHLSGYGGLPSAQQLQQKFIHKAVGGGDHDPNDNAVSRIMQHIEIVTTMRDAYRAAIGELQNVDQSNSQQMSEQTEQTG
ncbi:hypothetical protein [Nocardia higoensis]|uniref:hypothetical protein n=1 Tax=Nocardia higoensis TaxID=228599 RepID=UPI0003052722|nr:hypothetical protein [Nocardia higoensis]